MINTSELCTHLYWFVYCILDSWHWTGNWYNVNLLQRELFILKLISSKGF